MNDLIQRLREYAEDDCEVSTQKEFINSAADALEKQQAEIEQLKGYIQKANMDVTEAMVERDSLKEGMKFLSMHVDVLLGNNAELKAQAAKDAAEIERHLMEVDASRDRIEDLQEELTALKAQAAPDAADAGRYRIALNNAEDALSNWQTWADARGMEGFGKTCQGANAIALNLVRAAMKESQQ